MQWLRAPRQASAHALHAKHTVVMLFCPFCREPFEDLDRCPSHDLALVTLRELGALVAAADETALPFWALRRGRGQVLSGALLTLIGFFCPFGSLTGELTRTNTLFALARGRTPRLWIVPLAAIALLLILVRRRTGPEQRGARIAALFVSTLPSLVVMSSWLGARAAAQRLSDVQFQLGFGAWLVWCAAVLLLWGSAILGVRPKIRLR
jgi:fumarate reductase subunit D